MSDEKRKLEPPLRLDMPFAEALERFARTAPSEIEPTNAKGPKAANATKRLSALTKPQQATEKKSR